MDTKRLGQLLREARNATGKTQQQLAAELNISRVTLAHREIGTYELTLSSLATFCDVVGPVIGKRLFRQLEKVIIGNLHS